MNKLEEFQLLAREIIMVAEKIVLPPQPVFNGARTMVALVKAMSGLESSLQKALDILWEQKNVPDYDGKPKSKRHPVSSVPASGLEPRPISVPPIG